MAMSSLVDELLKEFECSICMERLRNPRCLFCQHAFCHECLESCVQSGREEANRITCPVCRDVTRLPRAGVQGLKTNPLITSALEKLAGWKDGGSSRATTKCASNKGSELLTCKLHPQMNVTHYCVPCDKICCKLCMKNDHKSHTDSHITLQQRVSGIKHTMQNLVEQCNDKNIAIQTAHHEVNHLKEQALETVNKLKLEVRQKAEKVKSRVKDKEQELVRRLDGMVAKVEEEMGEKQAKCRQLEEGLQAAVGEWGTLQQSDNNAEIVTQNESIQSKMRDLVHSKVSTGSEFLEFLQRSELQFVPGELYMETTNQGDLGKLEVCRQWNLLDQFEPVGAVSQLMYTYDGRLVIGNVQDGIEIIERNLNCSRLVPDDCIRDLTVLPNGGIIYQNNINEMFLIKDGGSDPVRNLGKFDGQWVSLASIAGKSLQSSIAVYMASRNSTDQVIVIIDTTGKEVDRLHMSYNQGVRRMTFDCNRRPLFIDYNRTGVHWPDLRNGGPERLKIAEEDCVYLAVACNQSAFVYVASQKVHTPNVINISKHSLDDGRLVEVIWGGYRVRGSFHLMMANWKDKEIAFSTGGTICILRSEKVEWSSQILSQF